MAPAAFADSRARKRSVSFEILRRDVTDNEEDFLPLSKSELLSEKNASRRRRRSKNRKSDKLQQSVSLSPASNTDFVGLLEESSATSEPLINGSVLLDLGENGYHAESPASSAPSGNGSVLLDLGENGYHAESPASSAPSGNGSVYEANGFHSESADLSEDSTTYGLHSPKSSLTDCSSSPPVGLLSPLLRQRTITNIEGEAESEVKSVKNEGDKSLTALPQAFDLNNGENLDWQQVMNGNCEYPSVAEVEFSPIQHVLDELTGGTSLELTTRAGSEQSRERVYNVLFNVPWRCELLLEVGFFVCLDSFLSLLTVTPIRLFMSLWRRLRELSRLRGNDFCDLGCLIILICVVKVLQQADISYIYHSIRFEPNIKLYVIYNMLEVFDKLFQSFGVDVLEVLFSSGMRFAQEGTVALFLRLVLDECIAIGCFIVHSFIILFEAITLSAALHHAATNRSLLMLLMSNNFAEIKSNVFKRFSKDNMHNLTHTDTVERFHILTCLFFVFVQNIMIVEGPWISSFLQHAAMVMICESFVDLMKHSFLAKFNQVKPAAYSDFLKTLCEQVVSCRRKDSRKSLTFVPLGPACVLIKVLLPLYAAYISSAQSLWKSWLRRSILALGTFTFLAALKIVVGVTLHRYASWYLKRSYDKEIHHHTD